MKTIGYARTSTLDQVAGFDAQIERLKAMGVDKLFCEQVSALSQDRRELSRALDYIRDGDGDVLVVTKLDRLARSVADLTRIVEQLKAKGAALKVLDSPIDMTSSFGELILNILGSIAQFERDLMLERQREGIAKAKAEGKYKGRKPTARALADEVLALARPANGAPGIGVTAIVATLKARGRKIGRDSVYRILRAAEPANEHAAAAGAASTG
jgi:DNA invertase Pin-like site-specific DNA recombinase